jgi:hypothetical protein
MTTEENTFLHIVAYGSEIHPAPYTGGSWRDFSRGWSGLGVKLNLHIVPRLIISEAIPLLSDSSSWLGA